MTATAKIETDWMTKLLSAERDRGIAEGMQLATSISLGDSGYGSAQSSIVCFEFTSFAALRAAIRSRRWHRGGENPGQCFGGTCDLLHIHHGDYSKIAVLKTATLWDV
jgi:hypothetical protein